MRYCQQCRDYWQSRQVWRIVDVPPRYGAEWK